MILPAEEVNNYATSFFVKANHATRGSALLSVYYVNATELRLTCHIKTMANGLQYKDAMPIIKTYLRIYAAGHKKMGDIKHKVLCSCITYGTGGEFH